MTNGAAGSAIKGISVVPVNVPSASTQASRAVENHLEAGGKTRRPSIALSVFTISRDQRLSRWDLVEANRPDTCTPVGGSSRADGAESSSSPDLDLHDEGDHARGCSDGGDTACNHEQTAMSRQHRGGSRQRTRQAKKEERRRWRLRWRAGCVTDVADVSGLDVYPLPGDPRTAAFCATGARTKEGAICEEHCGRNVTGETRVSPAALVAVSGQGLQLVVFGSC